MMPEGDPLGTCVPIGPDSMASSKLSVEAVATLQAVKEISTKDLQWVGHLKQQHVCYNGFSG